MKQTHTNAEERIQRYRPVLVSLAEALICPAFRGHLEASDLVQQTLLEAHRHSELLDSMGDAPFFQWLRKALQHNVMDAVKSLKTKKNDVSRKRRGVDLEDSFIRLEQLLAADETSPSQVAQKNELTARMLAALQKLPDNQRIAVMMKHLRGCTLKEIAATLQLSAPAVAGLLHRGRSKLATSLEIDGHD